MQIYAQLDVIGAQCRQHLIATGHSLSVNDMNGDGLAEICTSICAFLRSQGFDAAPEGEFLLNRRKYSYAYEHAESFHEVSNHFPHYFLSKQRKTIPLSLVYVFVAVARRLGIAASPTYFPRRVIAHVSSPNPDVSDIYVDVFGSNIQAILSLKDDIPLFLSPLLETPASMRDHLGPTTAAVMLLRASRNIATSLQLAIDDLREHECEAATYASRCVDLLLSEQRPPGFLSYFPLDYGLLRDTLAALLRDTRRKRRLQLNYATALAIEKRTAEKVKQRSGASTQVKYFAGLVFKHARHCYIGCITGWDVRT